MKNVKIYFLILMMIQLSMSLHAQNTQSNDNSQAVQLAIDKLFDGMREGDSAKVASVFAQEVNMYTSFTDKEGNQRIKKGALEPFLKAIGTPHDQIWDEKIWNTTITIEGGIAQVWTDYAFFVGTAFSHCGVDAFHLIKDVSNQWKIVHLMDTRRKEDCHLENIPD